MARYLVTGGCGFIGSHLADTLIAEGHEVRILDNLSTGSRENAPEAAELMIGDVADRVAVRQAMEDVDGVFHLAAIASVERSIDDWVGTHISNLTGCITVFVRPMASACTGAMPPQPMSPKPYCISFTSWCRGGLPRPPREPAEGLPYGVARGRADRV